MPNTVLLIDDETRIRTLLARLLNHGMQMEVLEAGNGKEGLKIHIRHKNIDLIIVDIFMPDMDGLEFIRSVIKFDKDIKILAISGGGTGTYQDFLAHAKAMGATDTLHKPLELESLTAIVGKLLQEGQEEN
jgi:YesN/AraC family two-component response regulator